MNTTIDTATLADLVKALLTNPDAVGELDTREKQQRFVTDIARVVAEHCGGSVASDAAPMQEGFLVTVESDESLPEGGGIWAAMAKDPVLDVPFSDLLIERINTKGAWAARYNGVRLTHKPTGAHASSTEASKSEHANHFAARELLAAHPLVKAYLARGKTPAPIVSNEEITAVLEAVRPYVSDCYECAFPNEQQNAQVLHDLDEMKKTLS